MHAVRVLPLLMWREDAWGVRASAPEILAPVRVEPRGYLANERTLITWLHMASILSAAATGALSLGDTPQMRMTGAFLAVPGVFIVLYALRSYYVRLHALDNRTLSPFEQRAGPAALLFMLVAVVLANLFHNLYRNGLASFGIHSGAHLHARGLDRSPLASIQHPPPALADSFHMPKPS